MRRQKEITEINEDYQSIKIPFNPQNINSRNQRLFPGNTQHSSKQHDIYLPERN